jgi:hypothetical protein
MNLNNFKKFISTINVTFLSDIEKHININRNYKTKHFKFYNLEFNEIKSFILELDDDKIFQVVPFISITSNLKDPYLVLSDTFIMNNKCDFILIYSHIYMQLNKALEQFGFDDITYTDFYLYFKCTRITFE